VSTPGPVRAAVLVALLLGAAREDAQVVLTRRRSNLRRHAGEISFPGGREDPEDADLAQTALREAEEEIGLPRTAVSIVGELPATPTFATNYLIHPYVGTIGERAPWRASELEVEEVLELSLAQLARSQTRAHLTRRGVTFETDAYVLGENLIWGATARILGQLLERLEEFLPQDRAGAR
jgi:8-oxo-dGTP pyrophosphatase MutT (NUDIX family)